MKINYFDYCPEGIPPKVYLDAEKGHKVKRERGIEIDYRLLCPALLRLHKYSIRIFFYLLEKLEHNNRPIIVKESEIMRDALPSITNKVTAIKYMFSLIHAGLVIKTGRNMYYVNPVFAWKKGSEACFDSETLPVINKKHIDS